MKLPNLEQAYVQPEKITQYLLDTEHEQGHGKALFFIHVGFSVAQWEILAQTLIDHANAHEVVKEEPTQFGKRYVIEGDLLTPTGRVVQVRSVWFISIGDSKPRLVTAYPLEE